MEILAGMLGAVIIICSFIVGYNLGRKSPEKLDPIAINEEEKIKRQEEQKAYSQLFAYSPDVAYGTKPVSER